MGVIAPLWIFDLDNTLHNATPHIFPHINRSMTAYLQQHLQLDEAAANELRTHYWRRYGATMSGLMRHHGTKPEHFLWHTHQFPELERMVLCEPRLRHVLKALPGRKVVFSNAPQHYAQAVLKLLRVADLFDDVMAVEQTRFRPKPDSFGFLRLLRRQRVAAAQCIMVEDSVENLVAAKRLGMRTVWVNTGNRNAPCVDVKIRDVMQLPGAVSRLV
ncbi:MAG: pyrimidine 5'-nucleotidase [Gallionellales bacterium RIFCSPLOWO2_12_FULL_59_22]|nr:MAG: pyrimidine 5'-nucleotidase [Gallionellales bacterium RIFCSPLOWO2_02_FULL_59_110]OGT05299.1 MAG: pyrimidine 5'-nucleotidase [Gallionellales bacterium RIFCSPLOWO2_02_58_13]OGT12896.1 MAG: pyrimidine 5'-nucleotidase [Gallionellales bacterium RIFCSPLOWO2_12_FULL_59_22]